MVCALRVLATKSLPVAVAVLSPVAMSNVTPPVGVCLFIVQDITRLPLGVIVRATLPYLVAMIIALFVVAYVPEVTLWLPKVFGYRPG